MSYRRSRHSQYERQYVVSVEGVSTKAAAAKLVGKSVVWKSTSGKKAVGKVSAAHGNNGAVRVRLSKGLPGQALGTAVEIGA